MSGETARGGIGAAARGGYRSSQFAVRSSQDA
jgi:hypothetical protein